VLDATKQVFEERRDPDLTPLLQIDEHERVGIRILEMGAADLRMTQVIEQRGLADATFADDGHRLRAARADAREDLRHLAAPPVEIRHRPDHHAVQVRVALPGGSSKRRHGARSSSL
jgi:hypothetical protein